MMTDGHIIGCSGFWIDVTLQIQAMLMTYI